MKNEVIIVTEIINCGLIMPIAPMSSYSSEQFIDVKSILVETISEIKEFKFHVRMVSDSKGEVDIIHKNIVNNLYEDPIVICDVSGSNPNVLFELGMRLAFDKPTIIIKDDRTKYMFDTSMIEHLEYPSDLRYNKLLEFKKSLQSKLIKTYEASLQDDGYSPFLKHFQNVQVKNIESSSIDVTEALETILEDISLIKSSQSSNNSQSLNNFSKDISEINRKTTLRSEIIKWIEDDINNRLILNFSDVIDKKIFSNSIMSHANKLNLSYEEFQEIFKEAQDSVLPF